MSCSLPSGSATVGPDAIAPREQSVMRFSSARGPGGGLYCGDAEWNQRCEALCTLHFDTTNAPPPPTGVVPVMVNAALKARVAWRSGQGDGEFFIDVVRGHMATIGAVDVVTVAGFFEPIDPALPMVITPQRLSVSAHWGTSKSGFPAHYSPPGVLAAEPGGGTFIAVPPQAARVSALAATAAGLVGLVAEFSTDGVTTTHVAPLGPASDDAAPVVQGARFVRFAGPAGLVFPVFQLWT